MGFLSKIFKKAQAEIKVIPNKDIYRQKPKYVYIKKDKKLKRFKVLTNLLGKATLVEIEIKNKEK